MTGNTINDITEIILNCEAIQQSNESEFTKEQAKLAAYDEIRAVLDIAFANGKIDPFDGSIRFRKCEVRL